MYSMALQGGGGGLLLVAVWETRVLPPCLSLQLASRGCVLSVVGLDSELYSSCARSVGGGGKGANSKVSH